MIWLFESKREVQHIDNLKEVFEVLRQHKLHLNVDKCAFGVGESKFLGHMIISRGIEVNPDQIETVKHLKPPSNPKEVQVLTSMLAALNRFISKFVDRCRSFYQLSKKWKRFQWNEECEKAFSGFKGVFGIGAYVVRLRTWGEFVHVPLSVREHCKRHAIKGLRSATANILC